MARLTPVTPASARQRAGAAREFLELARIELDAAQQRAGPSAEAQVAATNDIHAGIAAADAICGIRLGQRAGGQSHGEAVSLLETVLPDGQRLAARLLRLTSSKSALQYGDYCTADRARQMVSAAADLVAALEAHGL